LIRSRLAEIGLDGEPPPLEPAVVPPAPAVRVVEE
jgi:hypothetical protein